MRWRGIICTCGESPKVNAYKTVRAFSIETLNAAVGAAILRDWQPIGGVAEVQDGDRTVLLQALVQFSE